MRIGARGKFIDFWSRAVTGPICFESDFDKRVYWPKLKKITEKWGIKYDPDPVSYTHLDVYKRQPFGRGELRVQIAFRFDGPEALPLYFLSAQVPAYFHVLSLYPAAHAGHAVGCRGRFPTAPG